MIFLEENINEITYDENWQNVSEPEYITAVASDNSEEYDEEPLQNNEVKEEHRKNGTKPILISIQLALCLAVAAAAFVMKSIGGELYDNVRKAYYTELNRELVFDEKHKFDLNTLFGKATADEV